MKFFWLHHLVKAEEYLVFLKYFDHSDQCQFIHH